MLLALKPFACLSLFCLSLLVFLLAPISDDHHRSPHPQDNPHLLHAYHHHLQLQRITQHHNKSRASHIPPSVCNGRRIYIHRLPPQFNSELLQQCGYGITSWLNFCEHIAHHGLGKPLHTEKLTHDQFSTPPSAAYNSSSSQSLNREALIHPTRKILSVSSSMSSNDDDAHHIVPPQARGHSDWHRTDAYMLEVIFHHRLLHYPCLTDDPDMADAFFLPYYTGLDALRYLYSDQRSKPRMRHGSELVSWIQQDAIAKETWKRYQGQDHFLLMGRTPWDFGSLGSEQWGTGILHIPEYENMTLLLFEKQPWIQNQHAIPYPTSFHPSSSSSLHAWMDKVRAKERPSLFAFAGSVSHAWMKDSIRGMLVNQCLSSKNCEFLDCKEQKCSHNPEPIMRTFLHSQFCLQPRGDTPTRRSLFDSIIAGCIPVLFHNGTAYTQYEWYLPKDPEAWSVYIDEEEIRKGVLVEETLLKYTKASIDRTREVLIGVIPQVVYAAAGMSKELEGEQDAFDVSVREVLKLISHKKRKLANGEFLKTKTSP